MPGRPAYAMLTIAIVVGIIYLGRALVFAIAAGRAAFPRKLLGNQPTVSVIVAARDEEANIARCLEGLANQDFPPDRYEVLVMDDGSTDRTREIVNTFVARSSNIRCVSVVEENSSLRGKARAVAQGIDLAKGEVIAATDADCKVGKKWLSESMSYFEPRTGIVAGFTLQEPRSLLAACQAVDWGHLQTLACAGFGLRRPLGCIGNNMFFRRAAYDQVGTYRGFTFSITEDLALLRAVELTGDWDYKYPVNADALVWSEPCGDVQTLWRQKRRWALGGKKLGLRGYLVLITSTLMNVAIVASIVTAAWPALAVALAARWISDFVLIRPTLTTLGVARLLAYFPIYQLYALAYELALPFGIMNNKVVWKGRLFE